MAKSVGVGILGLGVHGARYANHLLQGDVPNGRLVAVHRRNQPLGKAFAEEHGCRFAASPQGVLEDEQVQAVVVAAPPNVHAELTEQAADAGKHVLCEKPMARSSEECRRMIAAAERNRVLLGVAQTMRFTPLLGALRDQLSSVGDLYAVNAAMRHERTQKEWHLDKATSGGGAVLEIGVHLFDAVRYLTGEDIVHVYGETRAAPGQEVEEYARGAARLENGASVGFEIAKCVNGRAAFFELVGSEGSVCADVQRDQLTRIHGRESEPLETPENAWAIPLVLNQFCEAALTGGAPAVTGGDGLHAVAVAEAFYRSAASGASEAVDL